MRQSLKKSISRHAIAGWAGMSLLAMIWTAEPLCVWTVVFAGSFLLSIAVANMSRCFDKERQEEV